MNLADNKEGLQTDKGYASSIIPRRVRLQIQGTVARDFDYYIQPEFGYNNTYTAPMGSLQLLQVPMV